MRCIHSPESYTKRSCVGWRRKCKGWAKPRVGFTLIELMVSMSVLVSILLITAGILDATQRVWRSTNARVSVFRSSRAAFEAVTKRVSQATLNTYFDYVDAVGRSRAEAQELGIPFVPVAYKRTSELHFVTGQTNDLIPPAPPTKRPSNALFFQAPLGFSSTPSADSQLASLLNVVGFYVEYGDDTAQPGKLWGRPPWITGSKSRYRLMQVVQPTEALSLYDSALTQANKFEWFRLALPAARPVADNILAIVFWVSLAEGDAGAPLTTNYGYDTKAYLAGGNVAPLSRNQLPPIVQVTLVAIDEASAERLERRYPGGSAPLLQPGVLFTVASDPTAPAPSQLTTDLETLTGFLSSEGLNYRVFTAAVPVRQAKFSAN